MIEGVGHSNGRAAAPALIALGLASTIGAWLWATRAPLAPNGPSDASLLPSERAQRGSDAAVETDPLRAPQRLEARPPDTAQELAVQQASLEQLAELQEDELRSPLDPKRARTRDWYGEYLRLEHDRAGALGELASDALAGDGPRAQKVALLRALHDAPAADAMQWLEHAARSLSDVVGARGESVPSLAIGLIARAAPREPVARATLAELAFRAPEVQASLRRRSAALYAAHCPVPELGDLRRQLLQEADKSIAGAALASLDARANDLSIALWLIEFEAWERPLVAED